MSILSRNPATGEILRRFDALDDQAIEEKLTRAAAAFAQHRRTSFAERAEKLRAAAGLLETEEESFARIITLEMGKPIRAAREEIAKCASGCRYYATNAEEFLTPQKMMATTGRRYVRFDPLGPILAVMPWNFPFWQVIRFAAPALMAGNVGLLKHAGNVPQCALALEEIFRRAGFTESAFQTLLIDAEQTAAVIDDPRVQAVTLTGSERAGAEVASRAARQIKKSVLELGGSDPFIVMPSAHLENAVAIGVKSRTVNAGQSCIAAKRFIIAEAIYGRYVEQFVARMHALKMGDPLDEKTEIGPLASEQIRDELHEQVQKTIEAGAKLLLGGRKVDGPGFFYAPTVLVDVPLDSPAAREEIFGPVAAFFCVHDAEEAIARANDTPFGLGANAWTTGRRGAGTFRVGAGGGVGLHQRHGRLRSRLAIWRSEALRLWPRVGRGRHPRICERKDGRDRLATACSLVAGGELIRLVLEEDIEGGQRAVAARDVLLEIELVGVAQFVARVHLLFEHAQVVPDHHDLVKERLQRHLLRLERSCRRIAGRACRVCQRLARPSTMLSVFSKPSASTTLCAVSRIRFSSGT